MSPLAIEYKQDLVIVGAFNPAIIGPEWLIGQRIVAASNGTHVGVEMRLGGPPQDLRFTIGHVRWRVSSTRLVLEPDGNGSDLAKLADGVLEKLAHTPVAAIGINLHAIAPNSCWKTEAAHLPKAIEASVSTVSSTITEQSHTYQLVLAGGTILNLTIRETSECVYVDLNHHKATGGVPDARRALGEFDQRIEEGIRFVQRLASGESAT